MRFRIPGETFVRHCFSLFCAAILFARSPLPFNPGNVFCEPHALVDFGHVLQDMAFIQETRGVFHLIGRATTPIADQNMRVRKSASTTFAFFVHVDTGNVSKRFGDDE